MDMILFTHRSINKSRYIKLINVRNKAIELDSSDMSICGSIIKSSSYVQDMLSFVVEA